MRLIKCVLIEHGQDFVQILDFLFLWFISVMLHNKINLNLFTVMIGACLEWNQLSTVSGFPFYCLVTELDESGW